MNDQSERIKTLREVRIFCERKRVEWDHLDNAEQALSGVVAELDEWIKASENAQRYDGVK